MIKRLPVFEPAVTEDDSRAVAETVRAGELSGAAPVVREFERAFASFCGAASGAAVSSGTAALEVALTALRIGPGDEVICPSLTIISCARAILAVGARPVIVDVDPETWVLDADLALDARTDRTRAVLAVHLFGHPVDLGALQRGASDELLLVEDAAQAIGSELEVGGELRRCGSVGAAAAFSFYANKTITTGEGGMVLSLDPKVTERARSAANLFFGVGADRFRHEELGHNYRMSAVQAALGLSQMRRAQATIERKRAVHACYRDALANVSRVSFLRPRPWARVVPWMVAVTFDDVPAMEVAERLARVGVETRPFFTGLHRQPVLAQRDDVRVPAPCPTTEYLTEHGLYLPSSLDLDEPRIARVCELLERALEAASTRSSGTGKSEDTAPFGTEYAAMYDALYEHKPYVEEARVVREAFGRFAQGPVESVLDLGCGTGRHATALAEAGLSVTAVDRSAPMLAEAAQRSGAEAVRFLCKEVADLALGRTFDAVLMLFNVLGYQTTEDRLDAALEVVRRHLRPGGLFIADLWWGPAVVADPPAERVRAFCSGGHTLERRASAEHDPARRLVTVRYTVDRAGRAAFGETHEVRYFERDELIAALGRASLTPVHLGGWPDLKSSPGEHDWAASVVARAQ